MKILVTLLLFCCTNLVIINAQVNPEEDWPNLARYAVKNDSIMKLENNGDRVVFMGNSITEGWTYHMPEFMASKPYINRGISGQTTPQMLIRMRPDVVDLNPAAVVILAGTNDIAGNTGPSTLKMIADNIKGMAEIAHANGIKVIVAAVIPAYDYPWKPGMKPNEKIPALNAMLKSYAVSKGHVYLDYFEKMDDGKNGLKDKLGSDGVHPNKAGYKIMARLTEKAIKKALKK